jgi:tryptophan 2,3-dioxygenase
MAERVIERQGSRILTPSQYLRLREQLDPNIGYQLITDALLNTGLRTVEFWHLVDNPHWYHSSSRVIDLPAVGAAKKQKSSKKDRTIRLTENGCKSLDTLFAVKIKFKDRDQMGKALKRAAIKAGFGARYINPKMFRKMLVSYLCDCRKELGIDALDITANMGHDEKTLRDHYLGIGFNEKDHLEILEFLQGWKL